MSFSAEGFCVVPELLSPSEVDFVRMLSGALVERHRSGEELVTRDAVSVANVTKQHPQRNPGVHADHWHSEPFIIGDLVALDPRFSRFLAISDIWRCASGLLGCSQSEVVLHFSNLTRKPSGVGPAIGWHRDAANTYFAAADGRTVRLLFPLQLMSEINGGTAVVPCSHLSTAQSPPDVLATVCPSVAPGSALALHAYLLHGGAPNRSNVERDVIVLQFGVRSSPLSHQASEVLSMCCLEEVAEFSAAHLRDNPSLYRI